MADTLTLTSAEKAIIDWLQTQSDKEHVEVTMYPDLIRRDEGWIYLPMYVGKGVEGHKKARFMQKIEDSWNFRDPDNGMPLQVLIIPVSE